MTFRWISLAAAGLGVSLAVGQEMRLQTDKDKISYALGMDLGSQLRAQSVDVDPEIFAQALKASLSGSKGLMTAEEARAIIGKLQSELRARQAEKTAQVSEKNK